VDKKLAVRFELLCNEETQRGMNVFDYQQKRRTTLAIIEVGKDKTLCKLNRKSNSKLFSWRIGSCVCFFSVGYESFRYFLMRVIIVLASLALSLRVKAGCEELCTLVTVARLCVGQAYLIWDV
jgi:hypothetical protein